ncbi:MAG: class I SAM-dependent methyltransferase [Candidatus Diapherotrites archaeon]
MIRILKEFNNYLQKNYKFGFVNHYPFRTSIYIAKEHFKREQIIAVEIGTFKGQNALNILQQLNIKRIYLIDPYSKYEAYKKDPSGKNVDKNREIAKKRLKKYANKIVWVRKFSEQAVKDIKEKIDFIYIDGNHDYEYVKGDMENYWKILKEGGIMAGHDVPTDSVLKAFCEFINKHKLEPHIWNMDWWIFKHKI